MRYLLVICAVACSIHTALMEVTGQSVGLSIASQAGANTKQTRVFGEVTAIDIAGGSITVKADDGRSISLKTDSRTVILRIPPGETNAEKALKISLAEVAVGERVFARGDMSAGDTAITAMQIVVSRRAPTAPAQAHTSEERGRRGMAGRVTALNPSRKEITLIVRSQQGAETMTVDVSGGVKFLRFAPDSGRPSDALPSSFTELKVGDFVRLRGERSADGSRFIPEEIIAASITRFGGKVKAVSADGNSITVESEQRRRTFTIAFGTRSTVRRLPPDIEEMLARRDEQGGAGATTTNALPPSGRNFHEMIESFPIITPSELKKEDSVFVVATEGADSSRVTAILLLTGNARSINHLQRFQGRPGSEEQSYETGLPGDVLGGGTGPPSGATTNRERP